MGVLPHASVEAFFHEVISEALARKSVDATDHTEFYLVELLGTFAQRRISDEPLALTLGRSQSSSPAERIQVLKEVGDTTLYLTGFFAESLGRTLVDSRYYIGLGKAAYSELAGQLGSCGSISQVYAELSEKFPRFVDVLQEVRDHVNFAGCDVVALYEQWARTRSEWVERRLRAMGLLVPADDLVH